MNNPPSFISISLLLFYLNTMLSLPEKPLVVLVTSFNNEIWVEKNLNSIFQQQYSNFRIIYINDASEDKTERIVQKYINTYNLHNIQITLIHNKIRCRKLKNIYNAIHSCDDQEIIVQVDGDDYLDTPYALQRINQEYQNHDIWMTYGQYKIIPHDVAHNWNIQTCKPTPSAIVKTKSYRQNKWIYTHIRTFYAWLFKQIKLQDILTTKITNFKGKFFPCCNDMATFWSMLEMAGERFSYIPDILYVYNAGNPLAGFRSEYNTMIACSKEISIIKKYKTLEKPVPNYLNQFDTVESDCIILSNGTPEALKLFLDTEHKKLQFINNYLILYQALSKKQHQVYKELFSLFPCTFVRLGNGEKKYAEKIIKSWLKQSSNKHCILLVDTTLLESTINLRACIKELEKTKAYSAYLNKTLLQQFCTQHINENIYAWKYNTNNSSIRKIHTFNGALYRSDTLLELLGNTQSKTIGQLKKNFSRQPITNKNSVGIIVS